MDTTGSKQAPMSAKPVPKYNIPTENSLSQHGISVHELTFLNTADL
jgi:hypothetical protein